METIDFDLFPTLVRLHKGVIEEQRRKDIFEYIMAKSGGTSHKTLTGNVRTSYLEETLFIQELEENVPSCRGLLKFLEDGINEYAKKFGMPRLTITNSWYTIQHEGSVLKQHYHPDSYASSAIYINVDEDSTDITFDAPLNQISFLMPTEISTMYTIDLWTIKVGAGDILFFPSWLKHGSNYEKNQTKNRVIISFNTMKNDGTSILFEDVINRIKLERGS
jgi:uncharacterized protein (TIGR02466 family)